MGNQELKSAFSNAGPNSQQKSLTLDLMSEEQLVSELYNYVANTIAGSADRVKVEKLFPETNVQSAAASGGADGVSIDEVMKSQTIQKISDSLLSGFAPPESLLNSFQSKSTDEMFTALSPGIVSEYTATQKKRLVILYALYIEKQSQGKDKKINFFDYVKSFLAKPPADPSERMVAGFESGFQFVINLLKEIKSLTQIKGSGFPESMLINSLQFLHESVRKLKMGSLHNQDQLSFMLDANLNEARSFLLSITDDPASSSAAVQLAAKTIFLLGLARSSVEDLLLTMKNLEIQPYVDLRPELELIKSKRPQKQEAEGAQAEAKPEQLGEIAKEKEPVDLLVNQRLTKLYSKDSCVTDGKFFYFTKEGEGIFKVSIKPDGEPGDVVTFTKKFRNTRMSMAYLNGKIYLRSRTEKTKDASKTTVPFHVMDSETLNLIRSPSRGPAPKVDNYFSQDSDGDYDDEDDDENVFSSEQRLSGTKRSLMFTQVDDGNRRDRYVVTTPLISDGTYIYVITFKVQASNPSANELGNLEDEEEPSVNVYLEQFEPSADGFNIKFLKETQLVSEDGSKPFLVGSLEIAAFNFMQGNASCNGTTLLLSFEKKDIYFEVATGKKLLVQSEGKGTEKNFVYYDHLTDKFYRFEAIDSKLKYSTFTISGFKKQKPVTAPAAVKYSSDTRNQRRLTLQSELFYEESEDGKNKKQKKDEDQFGDMNVIQRIMFNVQASDLIEEAKNAHKYSRELNANLQEIQKTVILAFIDGQNGAFENLLKQTKPNDLKMMTVFKYSHLTLLSGIVFDNIQFQLSLAIPLIQGKKSTSNMAAQYNFFYMLKLLTANFKALNHCRLDLQSVLKNPLSFQKFMQVFQSTVRSVIENGYTQDFQGDSEADISEMKELWKEIYAICLQILSNSMNLIYSGNSQIMDSLEASLTKAQGDYKHAENSTMLLIYLCQPENMRQILENEESSAKAIKVLEMCAKITYDQAIDKVDDYCSNEKSKEEKKEHGHDHSKEMENLSKASTKFIQLVANEVMSFYCQTTEATEEALKKRVEEAQRCNFALFETMSGYATMIIKKVTSNIKIYLENLKELGQQAKDDFGKLSKQLSVLLNNDTAFLNVVQTNIHSLSLYPLSTALLAKLNPCLLSILEAFHTFNHEVNVQRKDTVSAISNLKQLTSGSTDGLDFDVEEFKKLNPKEQAKKLDTAKWAQMKPEGTETKMMFHECKLKQWGRGRDSSSWDCDMRKIFGVCFSGLTGFNQSRGIEGWVCRSCNYDCCLKCLQVSLYIGDVLEGKIQRKTTGPTIFEIDYTLKNILDAFSRNICWFLGQSAYKLITIKEEQALGDAPKQDEMEQLILHSNLLAGGIEPRLVEQVFQPEGMKVINDLQELIGLQDPSSKQRGELDEDKVLKAVIHSGQNEHVDRLVNYLQQIYERKMLAIARLGLANGLRITRAAFAALLKFGNFLDAFTQLIDEVDMNWTDIQSDEQGRDTRMKDVIVAFPGYEDIFKSFERASKMRQWINEYKNGLIERLKKEVSKSHPEASETEREEVADKRFTDELQDTFNKVVEKAEFLIKLSIPEAFLVKDQSKEKGTLLFLKEAVTKVMTDPANEDQQVDDWKDRLKNWKTMMTSKGAIHSLSEKNKDIFESSVMSVLAYLQAPISLKKIEAQVEDIYIKGKKRATGLKVLAQLLNFDYLPKSHRYDLMCWFSCGLRQNKSELTNYLDGLKGCGSLIEEQIRLFFFGIIKGLISQLQTSTDENDIKMIVNTLRWKFMGKDHAPLKHLELFRALYQGGAQGDKENMISSSWGRTIQMMVASSEDSKPVTEQIIDLFESLFLTVITRLIQKDNAPKIKLTGSLQMTRSRSVIDENDTESLLMQSFDIIFRELNRYITFATSYKGIDWNTFLSHMENPENQGWFEKLIESEVKGPNDRQYSSFNGKDKLDVFKTQKEIPFMKKFNVMTEGDYIFGIEVIYHGPKPGEEFSAGKQIAAHGAGKSWVTYDFEDGEFITELSVRTGAWMDRVAFSTNKGKRFQAGGGGGDHYDVIKASISSSKTITRVVAVGGAHGDQMKNLKAFYVKVPKAQSKGQAQQPQVKRENSARDSRGSNSQKDDEDENDDDDDEEDEEMSNESASNDLFGEEDDEMDEEERQLQLAIQQSIAEEAKASSPVTPKVTTQVTSSVKVEEDKKSIPQAANDPEEEKKEKDDDEDVEKEALPKEEEDRILLERSNKIKEELSKLKTVYSEQFLKRILRLLEVYTALASTSALSYLQPLQRVNFVKTILNLLILANPKIKMVVLRIIQNLLKINLPHELFENSITALLNDEKCVKAQKFIKNSPVKVEGSQFMQFLFSYLVNLRSKIWDKNGLESEGTYAVTSEIVRLLRFLTESCSLEHFRTTGRNKLKSFLTSPLQTWDIQEADAVLSLLNSGTFTSLMMGSQAFYKDSQLCVILGFSLDAVAESDLKALDKKLINEFKTSIYCSDPIKQKALVMFLGEKDNKDVIPFVKAVEVHTLRPTTQTLQTTHEKSILYDKVVLSKVMDLIKVDVDDNTPLVIRQSQVTVLKVITSLVETEIKESGVESQFLNFLAEEKYLAPFLSYLQRNASKPQLISKNELNLPTELLELTLTQIKVKCQESPVSLLKQSQVVATFSQIADTIMIFDKAEGSDEKKNSFFHSAEITSSINEDSLSSLQKKVRHSITFFHQIKSDPSLLCVQPFDLLFATSADLLTPESDLHSQLLGQAILNSNILVLDDAFEPHIIFDALQNLQAKLSPSERVEPSLQHRAVFLIDQEDMRKVLVRDSTASKSDTYETRLEQFNQFQIDLKSWAGFENAKLEAIKNRDKTNEDAAVKDVLMLQSIIEAGGVIKSEKRKLEESSLIKKLVVGRMASLSRKQEASDVVEDLGVKIIEDTFSPDKVQMKNLINKDFKKMKDPETDNSEYERSRQNAMSTVIAGVQKLRNQSQLQKKYVETLNKLLRLRSRTSIITFLHYLNPLPAEIQASLTSLEKLLLISYNEGVNMKFLTGSKLLLKNLLSYILRLFEDPASSTFALSFLQNSVLKPSTTVINRLASDKSFLQREVFDSEVDASIYPLPSMCYSITKMLVASPTGISLYKSTQGLLLNTVNILLGHVLAQTKRAPSVVTTQNKFLALAAKLFTLVRTTSKEQEAWPEPIVREIIGCRILREIEELAIEKIKGSKRHEQSRLLREVYYEWYCIRRAYREAHPEFEMVDKYQQAKFLKRVDYMSNRDPLTLLQLSFSAKTVSSDFFTLVKDAIEAKKKKEFKSLPNGSNSECLVRVTAVPDSDGICLSDLEKIQDQIDNDSIFFYYDKMCQRAVDFEELQKGEVLVKEIYMRYAPDCMENRLVYFGWCKNQRLPNGVSDVNQYQDINTKGFEPMIRQVSTCKNASMMLFVNGCLVVSGKIKNESDNENYQQYHFQTTVKLISAGRMTLSVVLSNNEVQLFGYNKDGEHFTGTDNGSDEGWEIVQLQPGLEQDDSIVDLACGTHFTLLVTKNGYLYGTGKRFLQIFGMENNGTFKKFKIDKDLQVKRVWASRGKETYLAIIEVFNTTNEQTYLMAAGTSTDGLLGQGSDGLTRLTTFTKLNYDHEKIQFKTVSMLTRHALALSTTGELYGWGSNEHFRLGQPAEVKSLNKPTPIDFFNNKQKFTIRDIASGDDHSFVYVDQDYRLGFTQDLIYQIGYT